MPIKLNGSFKKTHQFHFDRTQGRQWAGSDKAKHLSINLTLSEVYETVLCEVTEGTVMLSGK